LRILKENKQKLKQIIDFTTREGANKIDRYVSFCLLKLWKLRKEEPSPKEEVHEVDLRDTPPQVSKSNEKNFTRRRPKTALMMRHMYHPSEKRRQAFLLRNPNKAHAVMSTTKKNASLAMLEDDSFIELPETG